MIHPLCALWVAVVRRVRAEVRYARDFADAARQAREMARRIP